MIVMDNFGSHKGLAVRSDDAQHVVGERPLRRERIGGFRLKPFLFASKTRDGDAGSVAVTPLQSSFRTGPHRREV